MIYTVQTEEYMLHFDVIDDATKPMGTDVYVDSSSGEPTISGGTVNFEYGDLIKGEQALMPSNTQCASFIPIIKLDCNIDLPFKFFMEMIQELML